MLGSLRGGGSYKKAGGAPKLSFLENMLAGGLSRAAAQAVCHPLNVCKTLLQTNAGGSVTTLPALAGVIAKSPNVGSRATKNATHKTTRRAQLLLF